MNNFRQYIEQLKSRFELKGNSKRAYEAVEKIPDFIKESDKKENEKSKLPNGEHIHFPCFWAFEVFPPSYIDNLKEGLLKIGLVDEIIRSNRRDVIEHIDLMRSVGNRPSWYNLGIIVPKDSKSFPALKHELPDGILQVSAYLNQFGQSTTILSCQFRLKENLSKNLEAPFETFYDTKNEKIPRGIRYHSPIHQKKLSLQLNVEYLKSIGLQWMKDNFPGLYSSKFISRGHPTVDVYLFDQSRPFEERQNPYYSYLSMIGFDTRYSSYKSSKIDSFVMTLDERISAIRSSMILGAKFDEAVKEKSADLYSGLDEIEKVSWMFNDFHKTFSFWVLTDIASSYDKKIKTLRDDLASVNLNDSQKALPKLKEIENEVALVQINSTPFANEIVENIGGKNFYWDIYDFSPLENDDGLRKSFNESREKWLKNTAGSILKGTVQLDKTSNRFSNYVNSRINLDLSSSNNRLQFWIAALTIMTVIIAIFSFFGITSSKTIEFLRSLF